MRTLLMKEWREHRALILAFLVLAPLLSLAWKDQIIGWDRATAGDSLRIVIPVLTALFVLAIASDLVAGDASSGRMAFFAAMPARLATHWLARVLFLFFIQRGVGGPCQGAAHRTGSSAHGLR